MIVRSLSEKLLLPCNTMPQSLCQIDDNNGHWILVAFYWYAKYTTHEKQIKHYDQIRIRKCGSCCLDNNSDFNLQQQQPKIKTYVNWRAMLTNDKTTRSNVTNTLHFEHGILISNLNQFNIAFHRDYGQSRDNEIGRRATWWDESRLDECSRGIWRKHNTSSSSKNKYMRQPLKFNTKMFQCNTIWYIHIYTMYIKTVEGTFKPA